MTTHDRRRSYRPGGWFGIFGERASVLLPPSEKRRVAALWELVDDGAGFDEVLDALLATGLRDLPGFVLVSETEHGSKVVLRGPAVAAFVADGEMVELAGASDTTWVERTLSGVTQMFVQVEPTDEDDGDDLLIEGGLVRLARVDQPPFLPPAEEPAADSEYGGGAVEAEQPETPASTEADESVRISLPDEPAHDELPASSIEPAYDEPASEEPASEEPASDEPVGVFGAAAAYPPAVAAAPVPPAEPDAPAVDETLADHDGLTSGGWDDEIPRPQAGVASGETPPWGPPVARLLFSSGEVVEVDRPVLVGRSPEVRRFAAHDRPRLVPVPSPHQEISSTHLEVRPGVGADQGSAVVTDLGSTNGTVLVQPGLPPEELQPGIAVQLVPGSIVDLGDGVTIQVTQP